MYASTQEKAADPTGSPTGGWQVKTNWGGAGWAEPGYYGDPCDAPRWHGLECAGDSQVTGLTLTANDLEGTLPKLLGGLTALTEVISLSDNELYGQLPTQLGAFTALTGGVILAGNSFQGAVPTQLGRLSVLEKLLHLQSNRLSGGSAGAATRVPTELGALTSLTEGFR